MSTILRLATASLVAGLTFPAMAQVPVNDSERTKREAETRTCMERARTYKQRAEAPTKGVHGSVANPGGTSTAGGASTAGSAGSLAQAGGGNVMGSALSGTSVGGVDLSGIMAVAGGVAALKSEHRGTGHQCDECCQRRDRRQQEQPCHTGSGDRLCQYSPRRVRPEFIRPSFRSERLGTGGAEWNNHAAAAQPTAPRPDGRGKCHVQHHGLRQIESPAGR